MEIIKKQDFFCVFSENKCLCELKFFGKEFMQCSIKHNAFVIEDLLNCLKSNYSGYFLAFYEDNVCINSRFEFYFKNHVMHYSMIYSSQIEKKDQIDKNLILDNDFLYKKSDNINHETILCLNKAFDKKDAVEKWISDFSKIEYDKKNYTLSTKDGKVVSCLLIVKTNSNDIYIFLSATNPEFQNQGCFKFLFFKLLLDYPETNILLGVFSNEIAYKVYLKLGFKLKGINSFKI